MTARRIFQLMAELTDVSLDGLSDGQSLVWDASAEKWVPAFAGPKDISVAFPIATLTVAGDAYQFPIAKALPVVVINGIATFDRGSGEAFEFPVAQGGDGAPSGSFATDGILIYFTAHGQNWQFPATLIIP